jgi:hypothetical protein
MWLRIQTNLTFGMNIPSSSCDGDITRACKERKRLVFLMNTSTKKWKRTPEIIG